MTRATDRADVPAEPLQRLIDRCCDIFLDDGEPIVERERLDFRPNDSADIKQWLQAIVSEGSGLK